MQDALGTWAIRGTIAIVTATPRAALVYSASTTNTAEILYFSVSQSGVTTSLMEQVQLARYTAAPTVTIGAVGTNIFDYTGNTSGGAGTFRGTLGTSNTGVVATTAGTIADIVQMYNFNQLAGYEWNAQPNMRVWVPISGFIGVVIKGVIAATTTWDVTMVVRESK